MIFRPGDFVSVRYPLKFTDPEPFHESRKVRRMGRSETSSPDIQAGTGGVVLGPIFANSIDLLIVWINDERCIVWDDLIELVSEFPGKTVGHDD